MSTIVVGTTTSTKHHSIYSCFMACSWRTLHTQREAATHIHAGRSTGYHKLEGKLNVASDALFASTSMHYALDMALCSGAGHPAAVTAFSMQCPWEGCTSVIELPTSTALRT